MAFRFAAIAVAVVLACSFYPVSADVAGPLRWCLKSPDEQEFCQNMTTIFNRIDPYNHTWSCVTRDGEDGCVAALASGEADFVSVDSGDVYAAYSKNGAIVVAQEANAAGGPSYWAVAVVKSQDCGSGKTINDFKGKSSCHTGYRRSSGWLLPFYTALIKQKSIPVVNRNQSMANDKESIMAFFSKSCAPGAADAGPKDGGSVCTLCPNDCASDSKYSDYEGALNCLMNGGGDIAFTKHNIASEYSKDGVKSQAWSILSSGDLKLLCPTGGCADVSGYKDCSWGSTRGHAIITRKDIAADEITEVLGLFEKANSDAVFADLFLDGKNTNNLIFKADTVRITSVYPQTAVEYLGEEYGVYKDVKALDDTAPLTSAGGSVRVSLFVLLSAFLAALALW